MIDRTILKLLSEPRGIECRPIYEGWIRVSLINKLLWGVKGWGNSGRRGSEERQMCEGLEVFNSILKVVLSLGFGQSTGSG